VKLATIILLAALICTIAACGSNFEWFPDPADNIRPTITATVDSAVFGNNSSSTIRTATVSSFPVTVDFSANEPAVVYYTLDGSDPTTAAARVNIDVEGDLVAGPVITDNNTTLKFFGVDKSREKNRSVIQRILIKSSDATPAVITTLIGTATMTASGTTAVSSLPAQVVFSANEPATIYYTVDNSTPSLSSPSVVITAATTSVNGPLITAAGTILKFFSVDRVANSSAVQSTTVTIGSGGDTTTPSVWSLVSGLTFTNSGNISALTNPAPVKFIASEPVTIYYTTNGVEPTTSSPSTTIGESHEATGPTISVTNTVIWFFGIDSANNQSSKVKQTISLP
jgi:hypothetical protein